MPKISILCEMRKGLWECNRSVDTVDSLKRYGIVLLLVAAVSKRRLDKVPIVIYETE